MFLEHPWNVTSPKADRVFLLLSFSRLQASPSTSAQRPEVPAPPPPPPPVPITPGTSRWLDSSARAAERLQQNQKKDQVQQQRLLETTQPVSQPSTFSREISRFRNTVVDSAQNTEDAYGTNTFTKKRCCYFTHYLALANQFRF